MPYSTPPLARQLEHGRFNRFLAILPPHDFSLLAPHLRTIALERGVMLHDVGDGLELGRVANRGRQPSTPTFDGLRPSSLPEAVHDRWWHGREVPRRTGNVG